jgi:hypothetical protein
MMNYLNSFFTFTLPSTTADVPFFNGFLNGLDNRLEPQEIESVRKLNGANDFGIN